jgi:nucleotide-binding universal stress UspA family protein
VINPLKSEADAFRFTMLVVGLAAPVVLVAVVWSSTAAVGVGLGLLLGVFVGLFVLKRDEPEPRMVLGRPLESDGRRRILVVANETLTGAALRQEIGHRIRDQEAEVFVVCPALNVSRIKHWVSDEDEARRQAQERLDSVVARLRRDGVSVKGEIGDADPLQALEDALRLFPADEVIVSTHPHGRSLWLERGVVERARERFPIPITHVVVDLEHESEFVAQKEE